MSLPILITAFCRPQLTRQAIVNALSLEGPHTIFVSHDGAIRGFFEAEHRSTRELLISEFGQNPRVKLLLRDKNQGISNHIVQSMGIILESFQALIFLEEDMELSQEGYSFLSQITLDSVPQERIAYSSTGHLAKLGASRHSRFPEQWGISLNQRMYKEFSEVLQQRKIRHSVIFKTLRNMELRLTQKLAAYLYWSRLFKQELNQPHGWDAALQYAAWQVNATISISNVCHILDTASCTSEGGGFTKHQVRKLDQVVHFHKPEKNFPDICSRCELIDFQRRQITLLRELRSALQIRSRIMRRFKVFLISFIGINTLTIRFLR